MDQNCGVLLALWPPESCQHPFTMRDTVSPGARSAVGIAGIVAATDRPERCTARPGCRLGKCRCALQAGYRSLPTVTTSAAALQAMVVDSRA